MNDTTNTLAMMKMIDLPKKKSVGLAIVLSVCFGWLGALYGNWRWALFGWACSFLAGMVTMDVPDAAAFVLVASWAASMAVGYCGAKAYNEQIDDRRRKLEALIRGPL